MEEACLNVVLNNPHSVVTNSVLLNSANPLQLLFNSVKHVAPPLREVTALLPHSSVASLTAEVPQPPDLNAQLPLTSVVNALRLLSSVVLSLAVLHSKVIAAVPPLLLPCDPLLTLLPPPADVTLPQPLPCVTSLNVPEDLAVLRVPTDVMPHPVAVPHLPNCHSIDVEHPLAQAEVPPHEGLREVFLNHKNLDAASTSTDG